MTEQPKEETPKEEPEALERLPTPLPQEFLNILRELGFMK